MKIDFGNPKTFLLKCWESPYKFSMILQNSENMKLFKPTSKSTFSDCAPCQNIMFPLSSPNHSFFWFPMIWRFPRELFAFLATSWVSTIFKNLLVFHTFSNGFQKYHFRIVSILHFTIYGLLCKHSANTFQKYLQNNPRTYFVVIFPKCFKIHFTYSEFESFQNRFMLLL